MNKELRVYWAHPGDLFDNQDPEICKARGWMQVVDIRDVNTRPTDTDEALRAADWKAAWAEFDEQVAWTTECLPTMRSIGSNAAHFQAGFLAALAKEAQS